MSVYKPTNNSPTRSSYDFLIYISLYNHDIVSMTDVQTLRVCVHSRVSGRLHGGTSTPHMSLDSVLYFLLEVVSKNTLSITAFNFSATFLDE